ncbi:uncharacterized protein RAG0_02362 [Rhynchosporium agropyri]|uniref:Uncharacterized protein n=1 Tax=Rhynchosporium agropyri TaxID=914238 RepID=A0A1E1K1S4_9HELO|nr:uncharacterized protein RAG0_02362 [Rhynchosporium agropyri]
MQIEMSVRYCLEHLNQTEPRFLSSERSAGHSTKAFLSSYIKTVK